MGDRYIGVEIGGTKLQVALGDEEGRVLERRRMAVERQHGAGRIREQIERTVESLCADRDPLAVGVGFGGPVDVETGRVALSYQVEGWADFGVRAWLEALTGLPVSVDNDANAAALGEAVRGAGRGYRLVFYTTLGSGMGGGMVIDSRIYHGARPGESEVGLMCFDKSGATVESHCCGWAVDARVRRHAREHPGGLLARLVGDEAVGEARFLGPALQQGDAGARAILEETAEDIAFGLSLAAHLFHPEVMVIGGGLSLIGEPLRTAVAGFLPGLMTEAFKPGPQVKLAALGEDVVCVGALLLARQAVHEHTD
jgi:glucokinase